MEDSEIKAISSAEYLPSCWKRYVDDTFVVIEAARKEKFLEHINNMDPHIQFTTEDAKPDGSLPFLDTVVLPQPDNSWHTQICICNGTITTICLPNIVLSTPSNIGLEQSVPINNCWRRKKITWIKHWIIARTQHGLWIGQTLEVRRTAEQRTTPPT